MLIVYLIYNLLDLANADYILDLLSTGPCQC